MDIEHQRVKFESRFRLQCCNCYLDHAMELKLLSCKTKTQWLALFPLITFFCSILQTQLEGHRGLTTNFEALLVSPYLRAFLPIFKRQLLYFSLFGELQDWQVCTMFCSTILSIIQTCRRSRPEVLCIKGVLRNFTKFTGKQLCQSLFFNKIANPMPKKKLLHICFPVNIAKFLRTPFVTEHLLLVPASELAHSQIFYLYCPRLSWKLFTY